MGLDIMAFGKAEITPEHERSEQCYEDQHVLAFTLDGQEESLAGLIEGRCYVVEDRMDFRAGSYSGYNAWRRWLCETVYGVSVEEFWDADVDAYADHDFAGFRLLINFADNEGTIGPEAAEELARAFEAFVLPPSDVDYVERYDLWRKAFRLAAGTGMVVFC